MSLNEEIPESLGSCPTPAQVTRKDLVRTQPGKDYVQARKRACSRNCIARKFQL